MELFKHALEHLLTIEGVYSDDAQDRGGETKYGITKATARDQGYTGPMKLMPIEKAEDIYYDLYWNKAKLDRIAEVNKLIALELFDSSVNCGVSRASKWLQRSINALRNRPVKVDGHIGDKTIRSLSFLKHDLDHPTILKMLNVFQGMHYIQLCNADPTQKKFIRGWYRRVLNC